jgi:hemoglobin
MDLLDTQIFPLVGEEGFARLVAGFYRRVPADDLLGPLYPPHDLAGAEQRLRDFLVMRFGGPDRYAQTRGHPRLGMRHGRFRIDRAARDRWVSLMEAALEDSELPEPVRPILRRFFHDAATFLINREQ